MNVIFLKNIQSVKWNVDANGDFEDVSNWTPQLFPGGAGSSVTIDNTVMSSGVARAITFTGQHTTLDKLIIFRLALTLDGSTTGRNLYFKSLSGTSLISVTGTPGGSRSFSSNLILNFLNDITIEVSNFGLTFNCAIVGTGNITKIGTNRLTLTNNGNTIVGDWYVNEGELSSSADGRFGPTSNKIYLNGGTLLWGGTTTANREFILLQSSTVGVAAGTATMAGAISGNGNFIKSGAGTLVLSAANSFSGDVYINQGGLTINADNRFGGSSNKLFTSNNVTFTCSNGSTINASRELILNGDLNWSCISNNVTWGGIISGAGNLTKSGTAALTLSAVNTFVGDVYVNSGILNVSNNVRLGELSNKVYLNGGTFSITASVTISREVISQAASSISVSSGVTGVLSSVISGNFNITKLGAGTLTLSGTNTCTGQIEITAGELRLSSNWAGNILVNGASGQVVLWGGGTISGTVTLSNHTNALISPGGGSGSAGTLTVGALSMSATCIFRCYSAATATSKIQVNGNVTLDGVLDLPNSLNAGTYNIIEYTGSLTDNGITLGTNNTGRSISINVDTANKRVQIIAT